MIKHLAIRRFKSLEQMDMDCRRVNVLIGKPNVGKSNILEALALLALPYMRRGNLSEFIRLESTVDLFRDHGTDKTIHVSADDILLQINFENGNFKFDAREKINNQMMFQLSTLFDGQLSGGPSQGPVHLWQEIKYYKFSPRRDFPDRRTEFLLPPDGSNLAVLLQTYPDLKKAATDLLADFGLQFIFKPQENKMEIAKLIQDVFIVLPYALLSDTLQRVIFYYAAMATNKNSILIFEEPESHSFPFYTKALAERIALDSSNQYFLSTHNPYLLSALAEKTPQNDLAIFVAYFDGFATKVRLLSDQEVGETIELAADVFFNLDRYTKKEDL